MKRIGNYNISDERTVPALSAVRDIAHRLRYPATAKDHRLDWSDAYMIASCLDVLNDLVTARKTYHGNVEGARFWRSVSDAMMWEPDGEDRP